ncbi:MAG TPA: hypothetical protein VIM65_15860 [Cyclobacteriaceae bacterium]
MRRAPEQYKKFTGYVLLGAGIVGLMAGGKMLKQASLVTASLGLIQSINTLAQENGVPAITGIKGMLNKVVPQLNGPDDNMALLGLGTIEQANETLLGAGLDTHLLGVDDDDSSEELNGMGMGNLM